MADLAVPDPTAGTGATDADQPAASIGLPGPAVVWSGEVTWREVAALREDLFDQMDVRPDGVTLDVRLVTVLDRTGVALLIGANHRAHSMSRPLALVDDGGPVTSALTMAHVVDDFSIAPRRAPAPAPGRTRGPAGGPDPGAERAHGLEARGPGPKVPGAGADLAGRGARPGPQGWVSALERYLAALWQGERSTATGVVLDLLGRGASPERIINDLLAEAQTIVGLEWHQGRLSIAGEHLATAITESVLHELGRVATRDLDVPTLGSRGQTAVTCGEGEWHTLPALMATTVLRLRGVHVAYVAPSVPADDLVEYLLHDGPTVVALTCSSTINLVGAWRSISALRAGGMTIVCAGRGFGPDGRWGWALGADQWAPDLIRGADRIQAAIDSRPAPPRAPQAETSVAHEILVLQRQHDPLLVAAVEAASTALPSLGQSDVARRSTRDRIEAILKVVAAAAIVGDPAVATEHVSWLEEGLQARQLPLDWASVGFDAVLDTLPAALVHTRAMALTGRAACSRTPTRPTRTRDRAPES